jgi:hypothetical protein
MTKFYDVVHGTLGMGDLHQQLGDCGENIWM